MSDFTAFLKRQTPLCMGLPLYKDLVAAGTFYSVSERSEEDFNGRNLFEQECPKSRICDGECLGRPIPMYPEIEPLVSKYGLVPGTFQDRDVWILKVDTCGTCPFKSECTKVCPSMSAFHERTRNKEDYFLANCSDMTSVTDVWLEKLYFDNEEESWSNKMQLSGDDIAWDCLSEPQKAAVFMVLVQGKSFDQVAIIKKVDKKTVRQAYDSGMSKLKEYGLARRALKADRSCLFSIEYYENSNNIKGLADSFGVSTYTVSTKVSLFRKKHGITK